MLDIQLGNGMKVLRWYRGLKTRFYDGPAVFNYPGRAMPGYRSPALLGALWIRAFAFRWLTLPGRILFLATGLVVISGMVSTLTPVFVLAMLLCSMFFLNLVIGWFLRPRLEVSRSLPSTATVGQPRRVQFHIRNLRPMPAWDLNVDSLPLPRGLRYPAGRAGVKILSSNDSVTLDHAIVASRRGQYSLPLPLVDSSFPFGLFSWGTVGPAGPPILVFPQYTPLHSLSLPWQQRRQKTGGVMGSRKGHSMEFLGCREFRQGDSPRHIHPPAWARLGSPVVKEFAEEELQCFALILDTETGPPSFWRRFLEQDHAELEGAISLAAAILDTVANGEHMAELILPGDTGDAPGPERGRGFLEVSLRRLALLHEDAARTMPNSLQSLLREPHRYAGAIMILLSWDETRRGLLTQLKAIGIGARALLVVGKKGPPPDLPQDVQVISAADVLAGKIVAL
jgi:uncharacterized protein (DUF58 family)